MQISHIALCFRMSEYEGATSWYHRPTWCKSPWWQSMYSPLLKLEHFTDLPGGVPSRHQLILKLEHMSTYLYVSSLKYIIHEVQSTAYKANITRHISQIQFIAQSTQIQHVTLHECNIHFTISHFRSGRQIDWSKIRFCFFESMSYSVSQLFTRRDRQRSLSLSHWFHVVPTEPCRAVALWQETHTHKHPTYKLIY
jgi:hypothetical protein